MKHSLLSRRSFLQGAFGSTSLALALPFLEIFHEQRAKAYANTGGFPQRFCLFFWGNGNIPQKWVPDAVGLGNEWQLSEQLSPLADVKEHIGVLMGYEVKVPNLNAHESGPSGLLSGYPEIIRGPNEFTFAAPTLDQILAQEWRGSTLYPSLEIGIQPNGKGLSFLGPDQPNLAESRPSALFDRLFGLNFTAPGEEPKIDPELRLRRSLLDALMDDTRALKRKLGQADRHRLEQHLDSVRSLEQRLALLQESPPNLQSCTRPSDPQELPDQEGRPQMRERSAYMAELSALAFACDLTRVISIWYSDPVSNVLFPNATAGHHQLTHDESGDMPQLNQITQDIISDWGGYIKAFKSIQEGDQTLLDHSLMMATTDVSYGRTHALNEYPILYAGSCGGRLKTNIHHRSNASESTSPIPLTFLQALGVNVSQYGAEDAYTESIVSELLV
jgi:hypothetical protein